MSKRLASLDALRGFDMFWIIGGAAFFRALADATDWTALHWVSEQTEHVEWHGFRLWDLIFPLFLFLAGVSMPFSMESALARGVTRRTLLWRSIRRGLTLVLLGVIYNGLLRFDFDNQRYASVLGRIGLGWLGAALIYLYSGVRGQAIWIAGLLLGYWAALMFVPVPGFGAGDLAPGHTLTDYVDRLLVPGRLHRGDRDPEGLFSTLPAIGTALLGVFAGRWLRSEASDRDKLQRLLTTGACYLLAGWLWSLVFPLNKNLWTSSFVLWCAGLSSLLLAGFYLIIDVWGCARCATFFVVIGTNAITVYLAGAFVDWHALVELALKERSVHPVGIPLAAIGLQWVALYGLYRRKLFLRV